MKRLIILLAICSLSIVEVNAQDYYHDVFGNARKYDVNVTYQPSLPVFYASMLTEKKRQYDEGVHTVQEKINSVQGTISNLFDTGSSPYEYLTTKINEEKGKLGNRNFIYGSR